MKELLTIGPDPTKNVSKFMAFTVPFELWFTDN